MPTRKRIDWPKVAEAFARAIPHTALHPRAMERAREEYLREIRKGGKASRWALAFSGGADSLALLLVFWAEGPGRWGRNFVVLHFNHRLRGGAADADEKFCRQVCRALGVDFVAGRWKRGRATGRRIVSEAEARSARHEFFARQMTKRKMRLLWLAHQQDDIAETMLMRLSRGSGTGGMAAPRPVQAMADCRLHLRPMLTLKKAGIVAALRAAGATWCEDGTNAGDDYFRNRVRGTVVPAWIKASGRDALAGAALSRARLEEDDVALDTWLAELAPVRRKCLVLSRIAGKPRAIVRRALHRWFEAVRPPTDLSRQGFELLLKAVERGKPTRFSLGTGFAVIKDGELRWGRGPNVPK